MRFPVRSVVFAVLWILAGPVAAASVYVKALNFNYADVLINGSEARMMWVGDVSPEGVALRGLSDDGASFEIDGRIWTLKPGQGTWSQAALRADSRGQFFVTAQVNGTPLRAILDTGATTVTLNSEDAERLGVDFRRGQRVVARTASGPTTAYLVTLSSVQVGGILLRDVQGSVIEIARQELPLVLIGMSFLRQVEMKRSGDTMLLQKSDY